MPVYHEGEPLFWTLARSHHVDLGAPEPTTYLPYAATIYGEGLHFPCIRIQENGKDKADLIRMGHQKIRVSNIWYGDYRAQVGACRTGERRLKELVERYGVETIKTFIEAWMDYGERRAIAAIRQTWKVRAIGDTGGGARRGEPLPAQRGPARPKSRRLVYAGRAEGQIEVPVYDGSRLGQGAAIEGPAIIEVPTTTIFLHRGQGAIVDPHGNYLVEVR